MIKHDDLGWLSSPLFDPLLPYIKSIYLTGGVEVGRGTASKRLPDVWLCTIIVPKSFPFDQHRVLEFFDGFTLDLLDQDVKISGKLYSHHLGEYLNARTSKPAHEIITTI
jgi:hypothetical protein